MRRRVKLKSRSTDAKKDRIQDEKSRTLSVVRDFITSPEEGDASTEDEPDIRDLRKNMSETAREQCNSKVSSRLEEAGTTFPKDDFDTTTQVRIIIVIMKSVIIVSRLSLGPKLKGGP